MTVAAALKTVEFTSRPSYVRTGNSKATVHGFYGIVEGKVVRGDSFLTKTDAKADARAQITAILEG